MRRTSITVPTEIDKIVKDYQEKNGISTWVSALLELVRKGSLATMMEEAFEIRKQAELEVMRKAREAAYKGGEE